jgi:hypothetical protein
MASPKRLAIFFATVTLFVTIERKFLCPIVLAVVVEILREQVSRQSAV